MQLSATVEDMGIVGRQLSETARAVPLTVNDREYIRKVDPRKSRLDVLRERLDLTGTNKSCGLPIWPAEGEENEPHSR